MFRVCSVLFLATVLGKGLAEIVFQRRVEIIYDATPKLYLRGNGFPPNAEDITSIQLGASGQNLIFNKDFFVFRSNEDSLALSLSSKAKKWVDLTNRTPPVSLILSNIILRNSSQVFQSEPIIVASVLPVPNVTESDVHIPQHTNELRIRGTGWKTSKKLEFYFDPPLLKQIAYEDVSVYPLKTSEVVFRLRSGCQWRETPGVLNVIGIDTGGGPIKMNNVPVATVVEDKTAPSTSLTVKETADQQRIYLDDPTVIMEGNGFNPVGNTFRFANGLLGGGTNYSVISSSTTKVEIRLSPGSFWRTNLESLPGALTLLAVNVGDGWILAVGSGSKGVKGVDIAMVFEKPVIFPSSSSSSSQLFSAVTSELSIRGTGFPLLPSYRPQLRFDPPLTLNVDYTMTVVSRGELSLRLLPGKQWRMNNGPLRMTAVNTRGGEEGDDGNGWISFPEPIQVAEVIVDSEEESKVKFFPNENKKRVYQSSLQQSIAIQGEGFTPNMILTLSPPLVQGNDFDLVFHNEKSVTLELKPFKRWRNIPGKLLLSSVNINGKTTSLLQQLSVNNNDNEEGVFIAQVLENPFVAANNLKFIQETKSTLLEIYGNGFTGANFPYKLENSELVINLSPTPEGSYKIVSLSNSLMKVMLTRPSASWLPETMKLDGWLKADLLVTSIDTGAGLVSFSPYPPIVATVVSDHLQCRDTCGSALDGKCDDPLNANYRGWKPDGTAVDCIPGTDCSDCSGAMNDDLDTDDQNNDVKIDDYHNDDTDDDHSSHQNNDKKNKKKENGSSSSSSTTGNNDPPISTFHFLVVMVFWNAVLFRVVWKYFNR
jgi:hypothetical protein